MGHVLFTQRPLVDFMGNVGQEAGVSLSEECGAGSHLSLSQDKTVISPFKTGPHRAQRQRLLCSVLFPRTST